VGLTSVRKSSSAGWTAASVAFLLTLLLAIGALIEQQSVMVTADYEAYAIRLDGQPDTLDIVPSWCLWWRPAAAKPFGWIGPTSLPDARSTAFRYWNQSQRAWTTSFTSSTVPFLYGTFEKPLDEVLFTRHQDSIRDTILTYRIGENPPVATFSTCGVPGLEPPR